MNVEELNFFAPFSAALDREAAADPEPERFTSEWRVWQPRHWDLERRRIQLLEAQSLTTDEDDPCPLASEGLAAFLDWSMRQQAQRSKQRRRSKSWA